MDTKEKLIHVPDSTDPLGGQQYDVVRVHNDSPIDKMNDKQKGKVSRFYEILANAMPLEGRDYRLEFTTPGQDLVGIKVVGLNSFGESFSTQVMDYWRRFGYKS